jgi:hypothetical protein
MKLSAIKYMARSVKTVSLLSSRKNFLNLLLLGLKQMEIRHRKEARPFLFLVLNI